MKTTQNIAEGGILDWDPNFLPQEEASALFLYFKENTPWKQLEFNYFGKIGKQPRLTAWYADQSDMEYAYSGVVQTVFPWTEKLLSLKERIEQVTNVKYNSCLLNYYRSGKDSVGPHADDEKQLGVNPNIASVSLGATRLFCLQQFASSNPEVLPNGRIDMDLTNGSLLVMRGAIQSFWKHSIPKQSEILDGRINLTFRTFFKNMNFSAPPI